jgi:threonine dehydratase
MITTATKPAASGIFAVHAAVCDKGEMNTIEYLDRIRNAEVYDVADKTPLELAKNLSERLGNRILMKREDLQPVFSFKLRGAYNRIARLTDDEISRGVICSSAGNHAQGVALAAKRRGTRAVIVMPVTTPSIKTDAVSSLGGEVVLHGDTYDDAYAHARELEEKDGLVFIHPFDDPDVIAGQGTIGKEILEQAGEKIDVLFVPVGGGGLIAGIAAWVRQTQPDIRIIGVEPEDSSAMSQSLAAGAPVTLDHVGIFADGVAVRRVGEETFRLCQELVDEIVTVDTDQICAAIRDIFEDTRSIVEPAGGLAVAGAKKFAAEQNATGQTFVTISCGANVNLGITEFNYRYSDNHNAHIFVGIQLSKGLQERKALLAKLRNEGFPVEDLSDNEMAKLHVRHMVGGRSPGISNERLFRFEFPERPGALLDFLDAIGTQWNISLFHYRNHGSDYGRILAGIDVPQEETAELQAHLAELGYPYWEESDNPAYRIFLS